MKEKEGKRQPLSHSQGLWASWFLILLFMVLQISDAFLVLTLLTTTGAFFFSS